MPLKLKYRYAVVPILFLVIALIYYFPLTVQGRVLASFDTQVYFYPNAAYLASRLRSGQIPLWNPYIFSGVPFLANSQVGALYPPHWLFIVGPVSSIYGTLIVGHVWLLAMGTYWLGRASLQLGRIGAVFAGVALAFGGFVGGMSGHLNQVEAFAWLPFGILALEWTARRRRWRPAFLAALPFAMSALAGHSQVLFLTAILAVGAAGIRALVVWSHDRSIGKLTLRMVVVDLARLAVGPMTAVLIASAQLVPTIELTRLSIRAHGLTFADAAAFSLPPNRLLTILAPSINQLPPSSEWYGWVGLSCLVLAGYALVRRPTTKAVILAVLALVGLVAALGQYTPAYRIAFDLVPGMSLYRVPARWLTFWSLAAALLGGLGLDALVRGTKTSTGRWIRVLERIPNGLWLVGLAVGVLGVGAAMYKFRRLIERPSVATIAFWLVTLGLTMLVVYVGRRRRWLMGPAILLILLVELFVPTFYLPESESVWPNAVESAGATISQLRSVSKGERVLALGDNSYDPGDLTAIRRRLSATLPAAAVTQYVTSIKHVDGLTPNLPLQFGLPTIDGYDGGILPLDRYYDLKRLFPVEGRTVSDGRLRLQLVSAPAPELLGWLNLRFLVMDRLRDQWIDGTYYDLGLSEVLSPNQTVDLPISPDFSTSSVGIVIEKPKGIPQSGELHLFLDGESTTIDLNGAASPVLEFPNPTDSRPLSLWRVSLAGPLQARTVGLEWTGDGPLTVQSLSLIGTKPGVDRSIPVNPKFRLSFLGDMKIYDNQLVLPRAFLSNGLEVVPDLDSVVKRLTDHTWKASSVAVAAATDVATTQGFPPSDGAGTSSVLVDEPERMTVVTTAPAPKMLVVTESAYPGWVATVDGADAPIIVVDVMYRGVHLPAGNHTVEFRYEPVSWRIGVILSGVGIIVFVLGLFLSSKLDGRIDGCESGRLYSGQS